jgi:soluble lytic murein transglycosylase
MGLMQLLPDTFTWIRDEKLGENIDQEAILDATTNIRYGTYYLAYLLERFDDLHIALAAYNAGEGRVAEWLEDDPTLDRIPFPETRSYVDKVLRAYARYEKKYN